MPPIKRIDYQWDRAIPFGTGVIVPGAAGVAGVFTFSPDVQENYQEIVATKDANPPQILLDPRGVMAWTPCGPGQSAQKSDGKSGPAAGTGVMSMANGPI